MTLSPAAQTLLVALSVFAILFGISAFIVVIFDHLRLRRMQTEVASTHAHVDAHCAEPEEHGHAEH